MALWQSSLSSEMSNDELAVALVIRAAGSHFTSRPPGVPLSETSSRIRQPSICCDHSEDLTGVRRCSVPRFWPRICVQNIDPTRADPASDANQWRTVVIVRSSYFTPLAAREANRTSGGTGTPPDSYPADVLWTLSARSSKSTTSPASLTGSLDPRIPMWDVKVPSGVLRVFFGRALPRRVLTTAAMAGAA